MNVVVVVVIGGIIGALDGVGIFFAAGEPFKIEIFSCGDLEGNSREPSRWSVINEP